MGKYKSFSFIRWWLAIILLIGLQSGFAATASLQITHLRVANDQQKTRLVFDLSGPFHHQISHLNNPERLIVDISNAKLQQPIAKNLFINTPVQNFDVNVINKQNTRLIFYLRDNTSVKTFTLGANSHYGHRLVIDLYSASASMPLISSTAQNLPELPPMVSAASDKSPSLATSRASAIASSKVKAVIKPVVVAKPMPVMISNNAASLKSSVKPVMSAAQAQVMLPTSSAPRNIVIVIDPGHGGKDPGASGPGGYKEKNIVLAISRDLQTLLNNEPSFHAVLTRNGDYFIPLRQRLAIARHNKADMFVAIHADAYKNSDAMGASVFALSERGATSEAARWLAEKENYSELIGGGDLPNKDNLLRSVLIDLSQTHTIGVSLQIGTSVLRELSRVAHLHYTRVEQAAFVVLKSPDIPSILVETGYISNPRQERQLINPQYQRQIAYSIMQGIKTYFLRNPPRGTLLAVKRQNYRRYIVAKGDSLPIIAQRFNINLNDLRKANRIRKDRIYVGQVLRVPLAVNSEYAVSAYPTLSDIH